MERKYIFFDIDGTLLDDNPGGKILESTYRTLDKLKENGHFTTTLWNIYTIMPISDNKKHL